MRHWWQVLFDLSERIPLAQLLSLSAGKEAVILGSWDLNLQLMPINRGPVDQFHPRASATLEGFPGVGPELHKVVRMCGGATPSMGQIPWCYSWCATMRIRRCKASTWRSSSQHQVWQIFSAWIQSSQRKWKQSGMSHGPAAGQQYLKRQSMSLIGCQRLLLMSKC